MNFTEYASFTKEELIKNLDTLESGLNEIEVKSRLDKYGHNKVSSKRVLWWQIFLRQFKSPFIYLLIFAALIAFFLGERIDALMIFMFVGINSLLVFYQEYRSEYTLGYLKKYLISKALVKRDGFEVDVDSETIVPGDVIILSAGDLVAADIRFMEVENLSIDESVLTGESTPVRKTTRKFSHNITQIHQASNIGFAGTTVVTGRAVGIVFATGKSTNLGEIAKLTAGTLRESNFEKEVARFSKFILVLIIITLLFILLLNIIFKFESINVLEIIIFSIALAVSVVPEALPVVTTFSLSRGALNLAKHKVVVKRLSAIQDLGSIEVLCMDKTGTLTENKMEVEDVFSKNKESTLLYATLGSTIMTSKKEVTNPFDLALLARSRVLKNNLKKYEVIETFPFDPQRRCDSTVFKKKNQFEFVARGAPESIFKISKSIKNKRSIENWITQKGQKGYRLIAVAKKSLKTQKDYNLARLERNLEFLGIIAFVDPIKKSATNAIKQAEFLGIKLKILTGDTKEVASSVSESIGLIENGGEVITGEELTKLTPQNYQKKLEELKVFARVSPVQKYDIIKNLQERYTVGFLGDGINDAPALKIADVAMAVSESTDIAREASDIVLLQKSLLVVVNGIKEGRQIFANTIKYITATLSSNFGNFYAVAIASLLVNYLPMLPLQLLLLNLLSDFPMIAIASDNVDPDELSQPGKVDLKSLGLYATIIGLTSSIFDFIFFALFYKISPSVLQTNWFIASVLTELVFLYSIRTKKFVFKGKSPSLILTLLTSLGVVIAIAIPFTDMGKDIFKFVAPSYQHLAIIFSVLALYFVVTEAVKLMYFKFVGESNYLSV